MESGSNRTRITTCIVTAVVAVILSAALFGSQALPGYIFTVAGDGNAGFGGDGGPPTQASLWGPLGVYVNGTGDVYIADRENHRIRKIDHLTGFITTVAGSGLPGYDGDGQDAKLKRLNGPSAVYGDAAGNIYFADSNNYRIRKLSSDGALTTVAGDGTGISSGDGGLATLAGIGAVLGIYVTGAGDIYLAEWSDNVVRVIDHATGIISRVAGGGLGGDGALATSASLNQPMEVCLDVSGNIYISELGAHKIRKVDHTTYLISTVAGTGSNGFAGDGGPATAANLNRPTGISVDGSGNLYFADQGNRRIRKVSGGMISTVAGDGNTGSAGDGGPATSASLNDVYGIFVDGLGDLYLADYAESRVRVVIGAPQAQATPTILWRHTDGRLLAWNMNGTSLGSTSALNGGSPVSTAWSVVGAGDFNADGNTDILWRHTDGRLQVWYMNGLTRSSSSLLNGGVPVSTAWRVVGVGDFDKNGSPDILWRHTDGRLLLWRMSGSTLSGTLVLNNGSPVNTAWSVVGVGDLNRDGDQDILFRHTDGRLLLWLMNGTTLTGSQPLNNGMAVVTAWSVVGVIDLDNDGSQDILWRHTDGRLNVWLMNSTTLSRAQLLNGGNPVTAAWRSAGAFYSSQMIN